MYICPVCKQKLKRLDNSFHCQNGHSFDIARKGYVNLLTTNGRNPKNAGDNAEMVKARTNFLDKNYYLPLAQKTAEVMEKYLENISSPVIIDSGCGEGFYTINYAKILKQAHFYGIDISKAAVAHCMTRSHIENISNADFAVASSFELPFKDCSADLVVSTFAPVSNDEYARVLKKGGKLVAVSPSAKHLFELKSIAYDKPYENKPNVYGLNKFTRNEEIIFEYEKCLENNDDIMNLFAMTPYCYKTSEEGVARLKKQEKLNITCGFSIQIFTKN